MLTLRDVAQDAYRAIDSLPVPVVQFHLAPQRSRDWDAYGATFGARLYTKLTAHTLCLYLNRLLGNPDWLQIKGLAFPS